MSIKSLAGTSIVSARDKHWRKQVIKTHNMSIANRKYTTKNVLCIY